MVYYKVWFVLSKVVGTKVFEIKSSNSQPSVGKFVSKHQFIVCFGTTSTLLDNDFGSFLSTVVSIKYLK